MNRLRISWLCGVLFLALSLSASAQPDWTRVGSTGTLDEASLGAFQVNGAALLHAAGSLTSVVARFNVDNVSNQFPFAPWNTLEMTSQDGTRCTFGAPLDFANNSYYVQVTINRVTAAVTPILFNLRLW